MATRKKYANVQMKTFKTRNEWLVGRGKTIGGSDAGAVMNLCKYRDNVTLWREKCGFAEPEDISGRPYVQYGIDAEPIIRDLFKLHHPEWAVGYEPNNMWVNKKYPFAHTSLDGWVETPEGEYGVIEVKTTSIDSKAKSLEWENNRVPDTYYCQLLHSLMVTEFQFAVLVAELKVHRADGTTEYRIIERRVDRKDVQADIDELERRERAFYWHVEDRTEPNRQLPAI